MFKQLQHVFFRQAPHTNAQLVVYAFAAYSFAVIVSPLLQLAYEPVSHAFLFVLSTILEAIGVTHSWHKYMITTDYNSLYIEWENLPVKQLLTLGLIILAIRNPNAKAWVFITLGAISICAVHLSFLFIAVFVALPLSKLLIAALFIQLAIIMFIVTAYDRKAAN